MMGSDFHGLARGRLLLLVAAYSAVLTASLLLAFLLRFDFAVPPEFWSRFWSSLAWILPLKLVLLAVFGQFRSLLTFFSLPDAKMIAYAMGLAAMLEMAVWFITEGSSVIPRGVIVSDLVISFLGLAGLRTLLRVYREQLTGSSSGGTLARRRTAIIGAGSSAAMLLRDIQGRPGLGLDVVCLIDDDPAKIGSTIHGQPVIGPLHRLTETAKSLGLQKVIIAKPEARPAQLKEIVGAINAAGLEHDILPSVAQLLHGKVTVSHLRRVEPSDLLGREEVSLDEEGIACLLKGKTVMVTGAGGSIGAELCRQVAGQNPARIVLVERSEPSLFAITEELRANHAHVETVPRAYDICREEPMDALFAAYRPHLVFHAAAHKHVPLMEEQPGEALRNNAWGTAVVARLAARHGVQKFVLISSDKAVNPTSVMGTTKRLAEMVVEEQQQVAPGTAYSAVRFGNVLGSSGSVVPIFRQQIAAGGPVTVTHPEVTRFFMSIPEAVGLILQSALQSKGGETFVLDMGQPLKIRDLARQMIELSGFVPEEDIRITYTGLRPGEKLYEEPIHEMENVAPTVHPKVRRLRADNGGVASLLVELQTMVAETPVDEEAIRIWLRSKVANYQPAVHR
jgi:FlaA1/EpsC-like NDP-sugar epimerase